MESQRVVVVVEDAAAARSALQWAVGNFIRGSDSITLLHVCPPARSRRKRRRLRLGGFQLALAFKDLCNGIAEAKVEIVVTEGELGETVVATVNKLGATTLVVGLHDKSFLYRAPSQYSRVRSLGCRVLAVRQHATARGGFLNAELTQIETVHLQIENSEGIKGNGLVQLLMTSLDSRALIEISIPPPKIPFPMFTLPLGVIWRRSKRRK